MFVDFKIGAMDVVRSCAEMTEVQRTILASFSQADEALTFMHKDRVPKVLPIRDDTSVFFHQSQNELNLTMKAVFP
jgi:hypothetical protein